MFALEKEMIPVLKRDLPRIFGTVHAAEEFVSGNGRPDLVFARLFDDDTPLRRTLPDYESLHMLVKHLNHQGRVFHVDEVVGIELNRKKALTTLDTLSEHGYLEYQDNDHFVVRKRYEPIAEEFVAIEAKLSDWRAGTYQAMRYQAFSNSAYLAIAQEHLAKVDRSFLRSCGIGLISVSDFSANLVLKARKNKPVSIISNYYLSERLVSDTFFTV